MHKPKFKAALALASAALIAAGCASFEETLAKADAGDADAQYHVAKAYASGDEAPSAFKDLEKAEKYFKASLLQGNQKAERALIMLYLENGMVEHYDEVVGKLERVAEGDGWHFGMDAEMLKKAPVFATALAKNGEFKKFKTFDKTVRDIALRMFHCPSAGIPYDNFVSSSEIREYERATAPAESFVYQSERKEEERAKKAQAEMEERIALEQRKREEEEARKEAEKARRSFEEDFSKLCKLDASKALDKIKDMLGKLERGCASIEFEEYEIQFEQEDPGRDWLKSFLERKLVDLTEEKAKHEAEEERLAREKAEAERENKRRELKDPEMKGAVESLIATIRANADKAQENGVISFCGFYLGMPEKDAEILSIYLGVEDCYEINGEESPKVVRLRFSPKQIVRLTKCGNSLDEVLQTVANEIGNLSGTRKRSWMARELDKYHMQQNLPTNPSAGWYTEYTYSNIEGQQAKISKEDEGKLSDLIIWSDGYQW